MASTSTSARQPHILLVPGYWLGAWAWDEVLERLNSSGARASALTLPGLEQHDPHRAARSLGEQAEAIEVAMRELGGDVVLVGHSGANGPVSLVVDRYPELVRRVVWVDSGPLADGYVSAPDLPEAVTELPLPDFDTLGQQASLEGLTEAHLKRFRGMAVPEPAGVARARVDLKNGARHDVATTLICCSMPSAQILEMSAAGHPMFAAVGQLTTVDVVDLPTGHWPMWSRPQELADAILAAASSPE